MMLRSIALAAMLAAAPATARDLPVPADKGWQHAATGLILRSTLLGLPRTRLTDSGTAERDIAAQFNDPALATSATVYLFHAAIPSVPVWFDRAEYQLTHRDRAPPARPVDAARAFSPPRTTVAAGLRRTYKPDRGPYMSEGLAVIPLGEWLVAIRLSSMSLDPAALDTAMTTLVAQLGWPADTAAPAAPAAALAACAGHLETHHAKVKAPDMMQMLLGSMTMRAAHDKMATTGDSPRPWCRDGDAGRDYALYRAEGVPGYILAIRDAGRVVRVYGAITLPGEPSTGGYAVSLLDVDDSAAIYPSFDALPQPRQVFELVTRSRPVSRVVPGADGKTTINLDAGMVK